MIGIPHSGKSTFSKYLKKNYKYNIVSTDEIKKKIYKGNNYDIKHLFDVQKIELENFMKRKKLIVADSNNSRNEYRNEIIKLANKYNYKYYSICIEADLDIVKERLINDNKKNVLNNLDFYLEEIELNNVDFFIKNDNTNNYFNFIDEVMMKINEENKK